MTEQEYAKVSWTVGDIVDIYARDWTPEQAKKFLVQWEDVIRDRVEDAACEIIENLIKRVKNTEPP